MRSAYVLLKERQNTVPRILRRRRVIAAALVIEKRVMRTRINLDVMRDIRLLQGHFESFSSLCREILFGIRANNRAETIEGFLRTRVHAVIRRDSLQSVIGAGPG